MCTFPDTTADCDHLGGPEVSVAVYLQEFPRMVPEPEKANHPKMGIWRYGAASTHLARCSIAVQRVDHTPRCMSIPPTSEAHTASVAKLTSSKSIPPADVLA